MELKLPELGEGVHEGELIAWKVKPGDTVKDDQALCEIMTDKATIELPSPFHGKVTALNAKEGEVIKVGQTILNYEGGAAAKGAPAQAAQATPSAPVAAAAPAPQVSMAQKPAAPAPQMSASPSGGPVLAAPSTRRLARELGVDLGNVAGTGPHGRIMREDLKGAGAVSAGTPRPAGIVARDGAKHSANVPAGGVERVPFRGLRKKIAEKMRQSKDHAAHFTYVEEADATELVSLRAQAKELAAKQGIKLTYLPFVMKAMVVALRDFPTMNSELDEEKGELIIKHYFNIGLSVQTDDGLTAPVIKNVESKTVFQIAREIEDVVNRARAKKLTMEDLTGGSITLTNAGSIGGLFATPVINYPEVAILGFNKIFKKPVVKTVGGKDEIVIRDWTYFSISLDHRVIDGAVGAEFMKTFIKYIENPSLLVLNSL